MDINKNSKWCKLRGRLHMLGYDHNLGEESAPLVEQLFSDLVHTTESLRESQRSTDKSEKESLNSDARLARENQALHLDLIMLRGEKAHVTKELKVYISKLDEDLVLLKSLNEQYLREIHSLEKDCKEKARLIRKLRRKDLNAEVQAVDGNNHAVSPPDDSDTNALFQGEVRKLKAQLENSQGHIHHLNIQIDELQETNNTLEEKLKGVRQKSSSKVAEITSKNHELCQEITVIRNLAKKLEQDKKLKLEKAEMKLQDLRVVIRKLQGVNKDLESQLNKDRTDSDLPEEHEQESRTDHQNDIHNGFTSQEFSDRDLLKSQLGDELGHLKEQNDKFEAMVDFLAAEKSRLEVKVQKMMSVEKVLVLELEGWRNKYGICGMDRLPSRLDAFVKSLEEERNHYRQEAEHYKNVCVSNRRSSPVIKQPDHQSSKAADEIRNLREELQLIEENLQQVTKEKVTLMEKLKKMRLQREALQLNTSEELPEEEHELSEEIIQEAKKDTLEEELGQEQLQPEQRDPTTSVDDLDQKEELSLAEEETQLLTAEKDSLVEKFQKKQLLCEQDTKEISELQKRLKLAEEKIQQLTGEKDAKMKKLKQIQEQDAASSAELTNLKEELHLAKQKISQVLTSKDPIMEELNQMKQEHAKQFSEASAEISKLKKELQQAEEKLQRLISEKGSPMEEFQQKQLQYEEHDTKTSAEKLKLEKKIKEAEDKLQQVKSEKDTQMEELKKIQLEHDEQHSKTCAEIVKLEEKLRLAEETIQQATEDKDGQMEELKVMQKSSSNKSDENSALKEKLGLAENKIQQLTEEMDSLMKELKQKNSSITSDEISNLKEKLRLAEEKIQELNKEKDQQEVEQVQHVDPSANAAAEVLKLKENLKLAEEKIQQLTEEKAKQEVEQLQHVDSSANAAAEVLKMKENLKLAEEKIQQVTEEKDQQEVQHLQHVQASANAAAEVLKMKENLKLAEEKIQQVTEEKDKLEAEHLQQVHASANAAAEVLKMKENVKLAEEKIQQLTEEKDKQEVEKKKQVQHFGPSANASAEVLKMKENLKLAEEKIQQVTEEKDKLEAEHLQHVHASANAAAEVLKMKESLKLAEEKIQHLTEEKDKQEVEVQRSANAAAEILKMKENLKLAEEKIQQVTEEKNKLEVEHLQQVHGSANAAAEVLKMKENLKLAEEKIQQLTKEKDKQEVEKKKQLQHVDPSANSAAEVLKLKEKLRQAEEKIQQLTEEKDRQELEQLQHVDPSANSAAEVLKLKGKLRQAERKIQQLIEEKNRQELEQLQHVDASANAAAEVFKLKEKLRIAEEKIQRVTAEKNSLREQLKGGLTSPLPYGCEQEIRILELQNAIHNVEQEKLELRSQIFALRDRELDARSAALVQNAEEAARQRQAASSLRRQQQQIQDAILDLRQMLSVKNDELQAAHSQMENLKHIIESLSQQVCQHKQEAEALRISFSALCIKKDVLQEDVVTKTKRLAVLQEQLGKKLEVEQKSREREMATQKILETHQEALLRLTRDNELIIGECRRLQDDVAGVTQEKQAAQVKMEEALREREELKQRVHSYVNTVSRIESILKTKDQENLNLAERFRTACSDVQEREQRLQQLKEFIGSMRLELVSSETERQRLHEALGRKERELEQHMQDLQTYKTQVATFAHGLSTLEEEVRVLQEEKVSLLAELASVRELCVKMDSDKEISARQLLHMGMELERATTRQEDALTEAVLLKEHLASEKLAVRNMEAMLSASRQEMFQAHRVAREKEAELKALRHRLTVADNKILAHTREVTNLSEKVTQLQTKMEVLSSKVLERDALQDTPLQDISFRPLRASSPVDRPAAPRQSPPDSSNQEQELSSGPT
ncbi:uncharacterized protein LOC144062102 isoform X2 [Vanacampus margaritifer]